ncbi:MAG: immune inhibitor A [Chloroflexota bacterium]|nr:immune inhibitor A [Chloroflexota bacterium]
MRAQLPANEPIELAERYGRTFGRALASKPFVAEPNVGDHRKFTLVRLTSGALEGRIPPDVPDIEAVLLAKSAHAYFYEDTAIDPDAAGVQAAADMFEATVWPTVTAAFGKPAIPGVDSDPRIIVLQADLGGAAGGYYNGDDAYLRAVRPLSNEAEMVYMDRTLRPGGAAFNVVLAHEFQHLIHANLDAGEETWLNEGLSEDASGLVGAAVSSLNSFEAQPETQLNGWVSVSLAHYGASAAFFRYLASRFGGDPAFGAIARDQRHGAAGVDDLLASTGTPLGFSGVFADWIVANVLNADAGPYANPGHALDLRIGNELSVGSPVDGEAHQFGTDYYALSGLDQDYVLRFDGRAQVSVLPTQPPSGSAMLWANAEDSIDTRLTREVDLTRATEPVLTFQTWYDIERWFDWGYVSVSTDGGATWRALPGDQTTVADPVQVALGPGYTGKSGGGVDPAWVDERVSLAQYAGRKVLLRFEYVTDGGTHKEGWAIDNVAIEGTSFHDGDQADAGWRSEGWVWIDQPLPQTYIVRLIEKRSDGTDTVLDLPLDAANHGEFRFSGAGIESATLAIAGSTEGTNQTAPYTLELARP